LCGSDGITYSNECELQREAACTNNTNLQVFYEGECTENESLEESTPSEEEDEQELNISKQNSALHLLKLTCISPSGVFILLLQIGSFVYTSYYFLF